MLITISVKDQFTEKAAKPIFSNENTVSSGLYKASKNSV